MVPTEARRGHGALGAPFMDSSARCVGGTPSSPPKRRWYIQGACVPCCFLFLVSWVPHLKLGCEKLGIPPCYQYITHSSVRLSAVCSASVQVKAKPYDGKKARRKSRDLSQHARRCRGSHAERTLVPEPCAGPPRSTSRALALREPHGSGRADRGHRRAGRLRHHLLLVQARVLASHAPAPRSPKSSCHCHRHMLT